MAQPRNKILATLLVLVGLATLLAISGINSTAQAPRPAPPPAAG